MWLWSAILATGKNVDVLVLQPPRMPITFSFALKLGPYKNVFGNRIPVDQQINIFFINQENAILPNGKYSEKYTEIS